ncbi:hypothetical protein [Paraperlucidibaca sp.]|uniref:hypothetical protein n=1 Tax=Paraperlucidibaca sp. TaxID=2708021 RepID=UPI0030F4AC12
MRSIQRDKRLALAAFHDTYDLRRKLFAEHQRKLREARLQAAKKQQSAAVAVSSSMAELMAPNTVTCDSPCGIEVCND